MNRYALAQLLTLFTLTLLATSLPAADTVIRRGEGKTALGEITAASRTEVEIKPRVGNVEQIPTNEIERIEWDGEPAKFKSARSAENSGDYERALSEYQEAAQNLAEARDELKADVKYHLARVQIRMGAADDAKLTGGIAAMQKFVDEERDHYQFFDAQLMLGNALARKGDLAAAEAIYTSLSNAPWPNYKMAAQNATGTLLLNKGDVDGAKQAFKEVAEMSADSPSEKSRKYEAMVGQAKCLQKESHYAEAEKILDTVIHEASAEDLALQAEAYVRLGDSYLAEGNKVKDAVMAYLHVDVIPGLAKQKDLHAEALYRLSKLWPLLDKHDRGATAAAILQDKYPDSEWTNKLGEG